MYKARKFFCDGGGGGAACLISFLRYGRFPCNKVRLGAFFRRGEFVTHFRAGVIK